MGSGLFPSTVYLFWYLELLSTVWVQSPWSRSSGEREARHFSTMDRFQHVKSITGVLCERNSRGRSRARMCMCFAYNFVIIPHRFSFSQQTWTRDAEELNLQHCGHYRAKRMLSSSNGVPLSCTDQKLLLFCLKCPPSRDLTRMHSGMYSIQSSFCTECPLPSCSDTDLICMGLVSGSPLFVSEGCHRLSTWGRLEGGKGSVMESVRTRNMVSLYFVCWTSDLLPQWARVF